MYFFRTFKKSTAPYKVHNMGLRYIITIYAPMIYTAPCVMFLMRADTLGGEVVGGLVLEIESCVGP